MSADTLPLETHVDDMTLLEAYRENFSRDLVSRGIVSQEFADSGVLNEFALLEEEGEDAETDGLVHMLVGDAAGGAHHLPTVMAMAETNVGADSGQLDAFIKSQGRSFGKLMEQGLGPDEVKDAGTVGVTRLAALIKLKKRSYEKLKMEQGLRPNGTYMLKDVVSFDRKSRQWSRKPYPSTMFPDEWSTEDVITAAVSAKQLGERSEPNLKEQTYTCGYEIRDVKIIAVVDMQTDKIITCMPRRPRQEDI